MADKRECHETRARQGPGETVWGSWAQVGVPDLESRQNVSFSGASKSKNQSAVQTTPGKLGLGHPAEAAEAGAASWSSALGFPTMA